MPCQVVAGSLQWSNGAGWILQLSGQKPLPPQFSARSLPSETQKETALHTGFVVGVAALMISDFSLRSFFDLFFFGSIKLVHSQIALTSCPVRIKEIPQPFFILSHFFPFSSSWHCICQNNPTSIPSSCRDGWLNHGSHSHKSPY